MGVYFGGFSILCFLLDSKTVLAAPKLCSLIRFKILSPFMFLWGFPWGLSSSGMVSLWNSNSSSSSRPCGSSVLLVPLEALISAPTMIVVFFMGILLRNSDNSWVVLSISSSG